MRSIRMSKGLHAYIINSTRNKSPGGVKLEVDFLIEGRRFENKKMCVWQERESTYPECPRYATKGKRNPRIKSANRNNKIQKTMDQRTEKSLIIRRMVIREILSAFHSQDRLTRAELVASCQKVKLDANWINRLVQAGIIKSSRGRNSTYSLAVSNVTILSNLETYVKKMHNDQVERHNERRRQAKITDYRREIKRLKAIINALGGTY